MADIMTTAAQLSEDLQNTDEFVALKASYAAVEADAEAAKAFNDFQGFQVKLQNAQMQGQQPSKEEIDQAQALAKQIQANGLITKLMEDEKALNDLFTKVNDQITKPIRDLYEG